MTVLSHQTIKELCESAGLVVPYDERQVRSAGYDLRIGNEYYLSNADADVVAQVVTRILPGPVQTFAFASNAQTIEIPANQVLLFRCHELLSMPNDLVGHLSLKLDLLLQGLLMASQSQIDAGYVGPIYGLLYNLSDRPVAVRHGQPVFRLELRRLDKPTDFPYPEDHGKWSLAAILPHRVSSSLHRMRADIDLFRRVGIFTGITILLTLAALVMQILGPWQETANKLNDEMGWLRSRVQTSARDVEELREMRQRVIELEARLQAMENRLTGPDGARVGP